MRRFVSLTSFRTPIQAALEEGLCSRAFIHTTSKPHTRHDSRQGAENAPDSDGGDPFTRQLQRKTEEELASVMETAAAHRRVEAVTSNLSNEDDTEDLIEKVIPPARDDEVGGPKGLEPTRFGDWERGGRCSDF